MRLTDVAITIARTLSGTTSASLRVDLPGRHADLAANVAVALDAAELLALAGQPDQYGERLSAMVFGHSELREAWQRVRGYAEGEGASLRVRLVLEGDDALHAMRWELLRDPVDGSPLAQSERVRLSRFLSSPSLASVQAGHRPELRAVVAVASPPRLPARLHAVDVAGEVDRARRGLGDVAVTILDGRDGRPAATAPAIAAALRAEAAILYLVCHGALVEGEPFLWLEREGEAQGKPIPGAELVQAISQLERRPLLVVLASCQGAGDTYQVLAALGPQLARAGVGAVLAMQGNVPVALVDRLTPQLFAELRRDGQIDRALAAARAALPPDSPWWLPVLWMAVRDGALWRQPANRAGSFMMVLIVALFAAAIIGVVYLLGPAHYSSGKPAAGTAASIDQETTPATVASISASPAGIAARTPVSPVQQEQEAVALLRAAESWATVLRHEFTASADGWRTEPSIDRLASVESTVVDNQYQLHVTTNDVAIAWPFKPPTPSVVDFYFSVDMTKVSGPSDTTGGVMFHVDDREQFYRFRINPDEQWFTVLFMNDELIPNTRSASINAEGANELVIIGKDARFVFFINEQYVGTTSDATLPKGVFNFAVGIPRADEAIYRFDNLEIRTP